MYSALDLGNVGDSYHGSIFFVIAVAKTEWSIDM
jgi:hypothetical protein